MTNTLQAASQPFAPLLGLARLMRAAFRGDDLGALSEALLARAGSHRDDAHAFLDGAVLLQLMGQREIAALMQAHALALRRLYALPMPAATLDACLRLLVVKGPGEIMWNTPVEFLVADAPVRVDILYLTLDAPWPDTVPEHDVMFVAVSESEANGRLLEHLATAAATWPRPVVNRPERIKALSRDGASSLLSGIAGLVMPPTVRLDRTALRRMLALDQAAGAIGALAAGSGSALIIRPLDSHAGRDLEKIDDGAQLAAYLDKVDAAHFYRSRFVDYRSADGLYRKYRIVLIDGHPHVCHFAVSSHWMVHYLNAGMGESADKRAEEAARMADFDDVFAVRHGAALRAVHERLGLHYLAIDCAETPAGELLIFEVGNAMIAHAMDDEALYPYKKPAMDKLFAAFYRMLVDARAGRQIHPA
jgi:glutathione synthase/RimK-type ligase-like ATP-grasp enzyme